MADENDAKMPGLLDTEITITVRGDDYIFKIPGIRYELEVGYRSAKLRRESDPDGIGDLSAVDMGAIETAWCGAVLELYLLRSSAAWPFSKDGTGKPIVRFDNFPSTKFATMRDVGAAFGRAVARFRDDRVADDKPAGDQAMAGGDNPRA